MAKSKAPSNSPSNTVRCSGLPNRASTLPVTSATAPCPAAIASAVTTSLTIVKMSPDRLGM